MITEVQTHEGTGTEAAILRKIIMSMAGLGLLLGLAWMAMPTYDPYAEDSHTTEAVSALERLSTAQVNHFKQQGGAQARFAGPAQLVPGNPTQFMCDDGESVPFEPDKKTWAAEPWRALNFQLKQPFRFAYAIETEGQGSTAKFTIRAVGDFDCDGVHSTFERLGQVDEHLEVLRTPLFTRDELE